MGHEIDRDGQDAEARLLRAVLTNASDAILVTEAWPVDEPGPRIVYANETFVRMTGYTLEDVMGKTPRILQSPDTERWKLDGIRTALESWKPVRAELLNLRKGGEEFWVEISIVPVAVDGGDRYTHWVSIQREVTARKRAEAETRREEERFRAALDRNASDVVFILEGDGTVRYGSPSLRGVLGYRPEDLVDTSFLDHIHPDDAVAVESLLEEAVAGTGVTTATGFRFAHADGTWRYLEAVGNGLLEDPGMEGIVINAWDTTGRKRAEDDAYLKDRAVAASSNGIIITDPNLPDNPIVYVNPKFEEITGYEAAEAIGLNCRFLANLEREQPTTGELRIAIAEGREWSGALRNYRKDGQFFWNELYIAPVRDGGGRLTNFIGIQKDITAQKLLEETLAHQAYYDSLTELPNRVLFLDRLSHALARSGRSKDEVAVLFIDLDNFKVVNDSLGHETGDQLLVEVAGRLSDCLRPADTAARLGGDEFVILLEDIAGLGEAKAVADRMTRVLEAPFLSGESSEGVFVTASFGIACSGDGDPIDVAGTEQAGILLRNADLAMYRAKDGGKNSYEVFKPSMSTHAHERLELETDLRKALERDEFVLHYQPEVSVRTGRISGMEALLRWEHPIRGLMSPMEFVPLAEETGLIVPIGLRVLEEACLRMREWQTKASEGYPLKMGVNLSTRQFQRPDLVEEVSRILRETGLSPECLVLEITETVMMGDAPLTSAALDKLKSLGVRIAVDDFGTGYSSLSYLKRFPVDYLKIDRSFVQRIADDVEDRGIVSATIALAHTLSLEAVAEGVETQEQLAELGKLGCDLAQGYYFSKPAPKETISNLLGAKSWINPGQ